MFGKAGKRLEKLQSAKTGECLKRCKMLEKMYKSLQNCRKACKSCRNHKRFRNSIVSLEKLQKARKIECLENWRKAVRSIGIFDNLYATWTIFHCLILLAPNFLQFVSSNWSPILVLPSSLLSLPHLLLRADRLTSLLLLLMETLMLTSRQSDPIIYNIAYSPLNTHVSTI